MENHIKMDDLGGPPLLLETPISFFLVMVKRFMKLASAAWTGLTRSPSDVGKVLRYNASDMAFIGVA